MATMDSRTLVEQHFSADNSLIAGDFEVIESNVECSENQSPVHQPDATVSQWTIQQSIVLDGNMSLALAENKSPSPEPEERAQETKEEETPVLDGSVIATFREASLTNGELTLESWDSNTSLEEMYAAHAETKDVIAQSMIRIDEMSKELEKMSDLEKENAQLKTALADKNAKILALENAATLVKNIPTEKEGTLVTELYNKGLEVDLKEHSVNTLQAELEAANRKIDELTRQASSTKYLKDCSDQLDEVVAKYINEKELTRLLQEQINSLQQGRSAMADERGMIEQLRLKIEENEKLLRIVKNLEDEIKNYNEITKVLREDHLEGNRLIAEKEHKISELEKMMESMDQRLQLDSS